MEEGINCTQINARGRQQLERTSALSTHEHKAQNRPAPAEGPGRSPRLQLMLRPLPGGHARPASGGSPRHASLSHLLLRRSVLQNPSRHRTEVPELTAPTRSGPEARVHPCPPLPCTHARPPPTKGNSRHGLPPRPVLGEGGCPQPWPISPLGPCFLVTGSHTPTGEISSAC